MSGELALLTDVAAPDMCMLDHDVTALFDVIVSRRCDTMLLPAGNHRFAVASP